MKVVKLNKLATTDVISHSLEVMAEKNVLAARQWDVERKEREHHFLRYRLFCRLEEMEEVGTNLGWTNRCDEGTSNGDRLDRAINAFQVYKKAFKED